jgi:hypothetical protein
MLSALVVEDLDQDLRECFWGNLKEASRPTVGTRRLVGLHGLQGGAEFGIGDRAVQLLTLCWCQPLREGPYHGSSLRSVDLSRTSIWTPHDGLPMRRKRCLDCSLVRRSDTIDGCRANRYLVALWSSKEMGRATLVDVGVEIELLVFEKLLVFRLGRVVSIPCCSNSAAQVPVICRALSSGKPRELESVKCFLPILQVMSMTSLKAFLHPLQPPVPHRPVIEVVVQRHRIKEATCFFLDCVDNVGVGEEFLRQSPGPLTVIMCAVGQGEAVLQMVAAKDVLAVQGVLVVVCHEVLVNQQIVESVGSPGSTVHSFVGVVDAPGVHKAECCKPCKALGLPSVAVDTRDGCIESGFERKIEVASHEVDAVWLKVARQRFEEGSAVVRQHRGVDVVEIHRSAKPKGSNHQVSVREVKVDEVLEVIEARHGAMEIRRNAAASMIEGVRAQSPVVVAEEFVRFGPNFVRKVELERVEMFGVVDFGFLEKNALGWRLETLCHQVPVCVQPVEVACGQFDDGRCGEKTGRDHLSQIAMSLPGP